MTHGRKLIFVIDAVNLGLSPFFVVVDRFGAEDNAARKYEITWHMETCELSLSAGCADGDFGDGVGLTIASSDPSAALINMQGQYEPYYQGWFPIRPSGPHEHRPIPTPVFVGEFEGARRVVTVLYPYKDSANPVAGVVASTVVKDNGFTIILKDGRKIEFVE